MGPTNFPLRWESTGEHWWFASPIDWAAANGHYDIVRELLRIDPNLLIKLTSLPRIRRLESVWDDDFGDAAKCRSQVAQRLLQECETKKSGHNSLIGAGYGGWLLYTAASAGNAVFVGELLSRDPLLVFGEGEYGVTDMFYAAARSRNSDVFGMLFDCSVSPRGLKEPVVSGVFWSEMVNRAVHAAAGGGSVEVLRGLLEDSGDVVLGYRDDGGSTVLHTASGRGQVEVVNHLISSHDILHSVDNRGNTALHVAAYHGQLPVLDLLVSASPSTALFTNNYGDTFLHMAVSGFRAPSFRRMDCQTELMKQIICGNKLMKINMEDIINVKNNKGRTALHVAVIVDVRSDIVELLMSARSVNLNIRDSDGYTPLDLLRQRPRSVDSEILIERLISAGGISDCPRNALVTRLMTRRGTGAGSTTPGTSFGIPDAEILLYAGIEDLGSSSCDLMGSVYGSNSSKCQTFGPMKSATRRLKNLLHWPGKHDKSYNDAGFSDLEDNCSVDSYRVGFSSSLRQQFSKQSILRNNKRIVSLPGGDLPSPSTKKKFVRGLTQGVLQVIPRPYFGSPASAISESSWSSPVSTDRRRDVARRESVDSPKMKGKQGSFNLRLMNSYLCFGAQSLGVEKSVDKSQKQESVVV